MRRCWIASRQAYTPRFWPVGLIAAGGAFAFAWLFAGWPWWGIGLATAAYGATVSRVQWWLWRHRHPVLAPEIVAREKAMWN